MTEPTEQRADVGRLSRFWRGLDSALRILLIPLGKWSRRCIDHLDNADRQASGLVLVLPGIEGRSTLNLDIAQGLVDGGVPLAVEVHDWTT